MFGILGTSWHWLHTIGEVPVNKHHIKSISGGSGSNSTYVGWMRTDKHIQNNLRLQLITAWCEEKWHITIASTRPSQDQYKTITRQYKTITRPYKTITRQYKTITRQYETITRQYKTITLQYQPSITGTPVQDHQKPIITGRPVQDHHTPVQDHHTPVQDHHTPVPAHYNRKTSTRPSQASTKP